MQSADQKMSRIIALVLGLVTLLLFLPVARFEFVNYDDDLHVTNNENVKHGLTGQGIAWAFTGSAEIFWHPVTWLSHMADVSLFGLNPAGHHVMSLLIHLLSALLLFYALRDLSGRLWPSALVAAWFAWHPLHVESVAWIAERKDVLSGLFFSLTLFTYARFVKLKDRRWFWVAFAACAFGLLSKTMLVTLPLVLLVLDFWPLQRMSGEGIKKLLVEKIPFFALVVIAVLLTLIPALQGSAIRSEEQWGLAFRLKNAAVAVLRYLELTFYPNGLAVYYPPVDIPAVQALIAGLVIGGLVIACAYQRQKYPWTLAGVLWFLIMLLPVIGLIKVGSHAYADRYTYLPLTGVFILLAFSADQWAGSNPSRQKIFAGAAALTVLLCVAGTRQQLFVWQNSITLFEHALKVTRNNPIAHYNLASALVAQDRALEALPHYEAVLKLRPNREDVHFHYGMALLKSQKMAQAKPHFAAAAELNPANAEARINLGNILYLENRTEESLEQFRQILRLHPEHSGARNNLGLILMEQNRLTEAETSFREAIKTSPENSEAHFNLGRILVRLGRIEEGTLHWINAARLAPESPTAPMHLAWLLASHPDARYRKGPEAVQLAQRLVKILGENDPIALDTLAAAHAEAGQFEAAVNTASRALSLARSSGNAQLQVVLEQHLKSYQQGKPWRQDP